jgi:nucleotide-binding universal stress UspA family protein
VRKERSDKSVGLLAEARECLKERDWIAHTRTKEGRAAEQIIRSCGELGADLIVVGSRGHRPLHRFPFGSVSQKVMNYAPCSALVVRSVERGAAAEFSPDSTLRILARYDDSEPSHAALGWLSSLPLGERAQVQLLTMLVLVTVYRMDIIQTQSPEWYHRKLRAREALEETAKRLRQAVPNVSPQLRVGRDESKEILQAARDFDAHLVVVGATDRSGIRKFLLGNVSNRIAHYASSAVLVVRPQRGGEQS